MRKEKLVSLIRLARSLSGTAEGLTLDEMTTEAGVNRRTAERMRDVLRDVFPSFTEDTDGRSKRFRIPGGIDSFALAPSAEELAELDIAARALDASGGGVRAVLLRDLAAKIRARMKDPHRSRVDTDLDALIQSEAVVMQAGPRPMADPDLLGTLRHALKARVFCHFEYAAAGHDGYRRQVAPYGVLYGRTYYLVGPELGKSEPVLYRLDRMSNLKLGDLCGSLPKSFNLQRYAARSFGSFQEEPKAIVLRFAPEAAADVRRFSFHPDQTVYDEPNGALVVSFEAGGMRELAHHLFTWGTAVEVLAPDRLQKLLVSDLEAALEWHVSKT